MSIDSTKQELRKRLRAKRAEMPAAERVRCDAAICQRVIRLPEYAQAEALFTYLSLGAEADTRAIIREAWACGTDVALPYCVPGTRKLRWFKVTDFEGFVRSRFGVEEPDPGTFPELDPLAAGNALALVPGLAFDQQGFRIGYGGGFYDTFLAAFPGLSVGLCREPQLLPSLSTLHALEAHDRAVDIVVSDLRMVRRPEPHRL